MTAQPKPAKRLRARRPIQRKSRPSAKRRTPFARCYRLVVAAWECYVRALSDRCVSPREDHGGALQAAHGIARSASRRLAIDPRNTIGPLCARCHDHYHRDHLGAADWRCLLAERWADEVRASLSDDRQRTDPITMDDLRAAVEAMQVALFERRELTSGTEAAQAAINKAVAILWRDERAGRG